MRYPKQITYREGATLPEVVGEVLGEEVRRNLQCKNSGVFKTKAMVVRF